MKKSEQRLTGEEVSDVYERTFIRATSHLEEPGIVGVFPEKRIESPSYISVQLVYGTKDDEKYGEAHFSCEGDFFSCEIILE